MWRRVRLHLISEVNLGEGRWQQVNSAKVRGRLLTNGANVHLLIKPGAMELGPELFQLLNSRQLVGNQLPIIYGARGLSSEQIASIEAQLGFRMPDDFAYLLRNVQDPGGVLFPWPQFDKRRYDASIEWVCTVSSLISKRAIFGLSGGGERDLTRCQRH